MSFFFAIVSSINRFRFSKRLFGWLVYLIVLLQSFLFWVGRREYRSFADCLFHFRKQANHPWINERAIEYPWIYKNITNIRDCRILDVGAKEGLPTTDMLLSNHNDVYSIDINALSDRQIKHNLFIKKGDIRSTSFDNGFFDLIIAVSTLEHVGISGRYGIHEYDEAGDIKSMQEIYRILKPGGKVLVTVPYGKGKSLPLNRLYDSDRIKKLFTGFSIQQENYFKYFSEYNLWFEVSESIAAQNDWDVDSWYSLGCFNAEKLQ